MSVSRTNVSIFSMLVAMVFAGCFNDKPQNRKADIWTDTLTFTYQHVQRFGANRHNAAGFVYPVFEQQQVLNDTVAKVLVNLFGYADSKSVSALAGAFVAKADAAKPNNTWSLEENADVIRQDSSLLIIQTSGSNLSATPQPIKRTVFTNWNVKAQKTIALSDILVDGALPQLNQIAEGIFRKQEKLKDTSSLAQDYRFEKGKFALNNNFSIMPIGLNFVYNPSEIKPYAAGLTDLLIPYSSIKQLLRPNTVVARYIK